MCLVTGYNNVLTHKELQRKMYLSLQRSVVEQFQSIHVKEEECLVSRDVYMAIGYEEENGKKAIQNLVPSKSRLRFGDVKPSLNQREDIFLLRKDTVLLKEPGLCCFLLRCKRDEAEPFMEWVVETVLAREVRKLASTIEEKDAVIARLNDGLQGRDDPNTSHQI